MLILASLPILLILLLMVGFRLSAVKAGTAGYLAALIIALAFFGANFQTLATSHLKAITLSLDVLSIIWTAYLLYRVSDEAGAIEAIGRALPQLTRDKGMQAILIGWVFASFLQGTGGFGVPVAVTAPLLVGLGFSPLRAVLIPTIGHGWAVTFGSLGSSFNALITSTGLPAEYLAPASALFLGLATLPTGLMVVALANEKTRKVSKGYNNFPDNGDELDDFKTQAKIKPFGSLLDKRPARRAWRKLALKAVVIGAVMGIVQYLVAVKLGMWHIASFAGGMAGLGFSIIIIRWGQPSQKQERSVEKLVSPSEIPPSRNAQSFSSSIKSRASVLIPLSPYIALIFYTAITLFFPKSAFTHPSAILFYSAATAFFIFNRVGLYDEGAGKGILLQTAKKMKLSSISIFLMVSMAMIMQFSGMTEALARGVAESVGTGYPFIASWIGAMGAFITGSNTNSNILFANLQMQTAELLGYSVPIILAAQTAGAGLASVVAPAKLIVGASTVGMEGKEGEVLRAAIGYAAGLVLFISFLTILGILL